MRLAKDKNIIKKVIIGLLAVVVVAGITVAVLHLNRPKTPNGIDFGPATQEQKQAGTAVKEGTIQNGTPQTASPGDNGSMPTAKRPITVTIADASRYDASVEVRSFVGGVAESGARCSVAFTQGARTFTREVTASLSASNTQCATVTVPVADFPSAGTWSVTVTYDSATSAGNSEARNVEVTR